MDTAHWPQELGLVKPMQELMSSTPAISTTTANNSNNCTTTASPTTRPQQVMERKARPQKEQALNCPRCNSTNTKFCYYNNYSLTQPRYFCKSCRRYWTEGGSLRNVPVGGGSRKNRRTTSSLNTSSTTTTTTATGTDKKLPSELIAPKLMPEGQDLNLAFPHTNKIPDFNEFPGLECSSANHNNSSVGALSAMELLRSTGMSGRGSGLGGFMPMGMPVMSEYSAAFGLQDFRPAGGLSFPLDGFGGGAGGSDHNSRLLFPFEDLKPVVPATSAGVEQFEHNRGQAGDAPGFWNGMIGGGGSWIG